MEMLLYQEEQEIEKNNDNVSNINTDISKISKPVYTESYIDDIGCIVMLY